MEELIQEVREEHQHLENEEKIQKAPDSLQLGDL